MRRKENVTMHKEVTMYASEAQLKKWAEEDKKKSERQSSCGGGAPSWELTVGGRAGALDTGFTNVDWSKSTF